MAQAGGMEVAASLTSSKDDSLWWEEDFNNGKFVALPDKSDDSGRADSSALFEHFQFELNVIDGALKCSANESNQFQGFVFSKVPSLVNLCTNKVVSCDPKKVEICIPPGLVPLLRRQQDRVRLEKIQLKWLLNELMSREKNISDYLQPCCKASTHEPDKRFFRGCRPAWETDLNARQTLFHGYTFVQYNHQSCWYLPVAVEGREGSDWCIAALAHAIHLMLPQRLVLKDSDLPNACSKLLSNEMQEAVKASIKRVKHALFRICPRLVNYCFDPAVAYVWWSRGDMLKAKEVFLRIAQQMPKDVDVDSSQPDQEGNEAASRESSKWTRQKAIYLNELGRLHSSFGQPQQAGNYYQQAADLCASRFPHFASDCMMQSLMLMSSAYDQGLMDNSLAINAKDLWNTVTSMPGCNANLIQMAADSLLHCHMGYPTTDGECTLNQNTAWLLQVMALLRILVTKAPQVNLHLSLVLAMLGEEGAADDAYMNYVQQYATNNQALLQKIPGAISVFVGSEIKPHPWWVFKEWQNSNNRKAGKQDAAMPQSLESLPLVWRRTFRYGSCDTKRVDGEYLHVGHWNTPYCQIADIRNDDLCLHLNKDGLLASCLSQNLPPLRPVVLDPYTGRICLPEEYLEERPLSWNNYRPVNRGLDVDEYNFTFDTFIPTPVLIYNSNKGTTVSLLWHQNTVGERRNVDDQSLGLAEMLVSDATLTYSSNDGSHQLSLVEAIMKAKKKMILEQLRNEGYDDDAHVMEDATDFLEFCVLKSRKMQYNFLKKALDVESRERSILHGITKQLGKTPARCASTKQLTKKQRKKLLHSIEDKGLELETWTVVLQKVTILGQSTVVLAFYTAISDGLWSRDVDTLVFVDCTSPETFSKPVIQCPGQPNAVWRLPSKGEYEGKSARIFIAIEVSLINACPDRDRLVIFDAKGAGVESHEVWANLKAVVVASKRMIQDNNFEYTDLVLHTNKVRSRLRLISTNGTIQFQTKPLGNIEQFFVVESMVFVSLRDRILILDSTTLEPIYIERKEKVFETKYHTHHSVKPTGVLLTGERSFLKVLSVNELSCTSPSAMVDGCIQVILGVANHVFVLQRAKDAHHSPAYSVGIPPSSTPVSVLAAITVPGVPTESCYISQLAGFVVTTSVFQDVELPLYRENLYWFNMTGCLRGVHPFLGPGPHCMFATQLKEIPPDMKETQELRPDRRGLSLPEGEDGSLVAKKWHIFFADGLGALCCIKLKDNLY